MELNLHDLQNSLQRHSSKVGLSIVFVAISFILSLISSVFDLIVFAFVVYGIINYVKVSKLKKKILIEQKKIEYKQKTNFSTEINTRLVNDSCKTTNVDTTEAFNYINSFHEMPTYDIDKILKDEFIKSIVREKEIEQEDFMKYTNTTSRPLDFVVFDFETTGLSEINNEIIQLGAIKFEDGNPIEIFKTYIKPSKKIPSKITSITGITNEMVEDSQTIDAVLPKFLDFIGDNVLIAHNAPFDMKFLLHNLYKYNHKKIKNKVIDTLKMARNKIKEYDFDQEKDVKLQSYKLEELKWRFGLSDLESHESLADCKVCAYIYLQMIDAGNVCYPLY